MIINDVLSKITVKVCDGSGCLIAPAETEYNYVLTAKHNVIDRDKIRITTHYINDKGELCEDDLEMVGTPYLHADGNTDAALIKVKPVAQDFILLTAISPLNLKKNLKLAGHPDVRKDNEFTFRLNDLTIQNTTLHGYIEGRLLDNATQEEVEGQSGGGVFFIDGKNVFLVGIQSQMSAGEDERLGRIDFMPIRFFNEIIESSAEDLCQLVPPYLTSFSFLKEQAMLLEGCIIEKNVTFTRGFLRKIADQIIACDLTPKLIKSIFSEKLVAFNQIEESLLEKGLWIAWLEFLIIMRIVNDEITCKDKVQEIFDSYRLIYSTTEGDWTSEMPNIIRSNYKGLKKDGKIIIATKNKPVKTIIPNGMIPDIISSHVFQSDQLKIDNGIVHPLQAYKLIHLYAFQHNCIILKEMEYKDFSVLNEEQLLLKLKNEYDELFANV